MFNDYVFRGNEWQFANRERTPTLPFLLRTIEITFFKNTYIRWKHSPGTWTCSVFSQPHSRMSSHTNGKHSSPPLPSFHKGFGCDYLADKKSGRKFQNSPLISHGESVLRTFISLLSFLYSLYNTVFYPHCRILTCCQIFDFPVLKNKACWGQWCTPFILACRRQRQEDLYEFKATLVYMVSFRADKTT